MAELIQVFIAISVTVSFLVMGSAMKHTSKFTPAGVAAREKVRMKRRVPGLLLLCQKRRRTKSMGKL